MTHEDQLAELLERWEETLSNGRTATPEDLCQDCPDLLADFRGLLARLGAVNAVLAGHGADSPEELTARVEAGRYRPLSFHAQGGLGIVFVAEDEELRRNVALKCMQEIAATDPDAQARFLREAEITSKLEHPGVVPVYGLGRDAHGKPYYAMRFIHGTTLAEAIEGYHQNNQKLNTSERHVELQRLLRRVVSVCETVAYAHARDIVHRDLKPSNILLGTYGETLVVDWGLAKRLDRPTAEPSAPAVLPLPLLLPNDGTRTMQGEVRGSPTYMSPEQARGEWDKVGTASDVYSLGSTLYVLLTGKRPYTGRTPHEVLEKVKHGVYLPLRSVNPHVPHPLAAICQRAMHVDPGARYGGPTELARDLERWLADEPVLAWSEPLPLRARRWLRRHQTLATSVVAVVVVAAIVLGVAGYSLQQKNTALANANRLEKNARQEAETNLGRNLSMLKDLLRTLVLSQGAEAIRDNPATLALLDELTAQMDRLSEDAPENVEVGRVKTVIHYLRAVVDPDPKLPPAVRRHLDAAIAGYEKWRTEAPDDLDAIEGLATTRSELGKRLYRTGDFDGARAEQQAAYDLLAAPIRRGKTVDAVYTLSLANACLGVAAQVSGKTAEPALTNVLRMLEETLPQLKELSDDPKESLRVAILVGRLRAIQGTILVQQHHVLEASAAYEDGLRAVKVDRGWRSTALVKTRIALLLKLSNLENERQRTAVAYQLKEEAFTLYANLPRQASGQLSEDEAADFDPLEFVKSALEHLHGLPMNTPATRDEVRRVTGLALEALDMMRTDPERPRGLDNSQDYVRHARSELESIRSAAGVH